MKSEGGLKTSALSTFPEMPSVMRRQFIPLLASVPKWNTLGRPLKPSSLDPPKKYGNPSGNSVTEKKWCSLPSSNLTRQWRVPQRFKVEKLGWRSFCHVKSLEGSKQRKNGQIELSQPGRSVVLELWNCNDQWVLRPIPSSPTKAANGSVSTTAGDVRGVQDQEPYDCQKGPNHANKPWGEGCQCSQN